MQCGLPCTVVGTQNCSPAPPVTVRSRFTIGAAVGGVVGGIGAVLGERFGEDVVVWPRALLATAAKIVTIAITVGRVLLADPIQTIALRTEGRRATAEGRPIGDNFEAGRREVGRCQQNVDLLLATGRRFLPWRTVAGWW